MYENYNQGNKDVRAIVSQGIIERFSQISDKNLMIETGIIRVVIVTVTGMICFSGSIRL